MRDKRTVSEEWLERLTATALHVIEDRKIEEAMARAKANPHVFSEEHEAAIKEMLEEFGRKKRAKRRVKMLRRVSVFILAFFTLSGVLLLSVEASRTYIFNMARVAGQQFEQIIFLKQETDYGLASREVQDERTDIGYRFGYVPEGFALTDEYRKDGIVYRHEELGKLVFLQRSIEDQATYVDSEDMLVSEAKVGDSEALYYVDPEGKKYSNLVWSDDKHVLILSSYLAFEEMVRIAENVERNGS